jgi:hypothetical protein
LCAIQDITPSIALERRRFADVPATYADAGEQTYVPVNYDHQFHGPQRLRQALANCFAAVTEVSGGQTVILLRGDSVRDMLAKGCPLDLHARVFGIDRCAQSHSEHTEQVFYCKFHTELPPVSRRGALKGG